MLSVYPSITQSEFAQACEAFEARCHDKLNDTGWMSVQWTGDELIVKEVRKVSDWDGNETKLAEEQQVLIDNANKEEEDKIEDDEVQVRSSCREQWLTQTEETSTISKRQEVVLELNFSITLSPTYSVPILWLRSSTINNFDRLYDLLVPAEQQNGLRQVGVLGGLSQTFHPISDLPSFFVHPCNTHDALAAASDGRKLSPEDYLFLWLGLVGSSLGLHIPSKLICDIESASVPQKSTQQT